VTLPGHFWKWRLRGAALNFFNKTPDLFSFDGCITTGLMRLADFKALCGAKCPPVLIYFHESQLTYPVPPQQSLDFDLCFADISNALAADQVIFNSSFHLETFLARLPALLEKMPDHPPNWIIDAIRAKARMLYPGCHFPENEDSPAKRDAWPPLIIWNHRWAFDKNPQDFFDALYTVLNRGLEFRLALLGENSQVVPQPFLLAKTKLGQRIVQYGFEPSYEKYRQWLKQGSIVISTARQENFGISIVEAMRCGCIPLLPNRLAYPEILPRAFQPEFLYNSKKELAQKLGNLILNHQRYHQIRKHLARAMTRHAWEACIHAYDDALQKLATL
jgi:glycosyltransferase involved in cell wall biosynthesis